MAWRLSHSFEVIPHRVERAVDAPRYETNHTCGYGIRPAAAWSDDRCGHLGSTVHRRHEISDSEMQIAEYLLAIQSDSRPLTRQFTSACRQTNVRSHGIRELDNHNS